MTAPRFVRRSPRLAELEAEDRAIVLVLDAPTCAPFELRETGLLIWQSITERPTALPDLIRTVAAQAKMAPEAIERDILSFTSDLIVEGLLVECAEEDSDW